MSFIQELRRRNVFKVAAAYLLVGWLVMQISDVMVPTLRLPEWVHTATAYFLIIGFLPAIIIAWAFELTPEGLRRETGTAEGQSIPHSGGQKLNYIIIGALVIVVGFLLYDRQREPDVSAETSVSDAAPAIINEQEEYKSIAVLPFSNLSTDEENAFFAAGVHEDILTHLSRVADLRVNSRTSVMQYAGTQLNMKQVASELGARYILEGSVRRSANRVRVTAQLIDAENDVHLWAENFDRDLTDIFEIQTTVAREISEALQAELSPVEKKLLSRRPTESIKAYDLFLQARLAMQDADDARSFTDRVIRMLEEALEIDPNYAQAWAMLAVAHGDYHWFRVDPTPDRLDKMKHAVDRAFELQPDMPEARLALANYYYRGFYDYPKALEQLERVRTVIPNDTIMLHLLALTYRRLGRYEESVDTFLKAAEIDPAHEAAWADALETASEAGLHEKALAIREELGDRFLDNPRLVSEYAKIQLFLFGNIEESQRILDSIEEIPHYYLWLARYYASLWAQDWEKAGEYAAKDTHLDVLVNGWGEFEKGRILHIGGMTDVARPHLDTGGALLALEVAKPYAENFAWPHMAYAQFLVLNDQPEKALFHCNRVAEILPLSKDKIHGVEMFNSCAWVKGMAGLTDEAIDNLEISLDQGMKMNYWWLTLNPEWDFLHDNERFQQLVERARIEMEADLKSVGRTL